MAGSKGGGGGGKGGSFTPPANQYEVDMAQVITTRSQGYPRLLIIR